jgi:hypothetical protein
MATGIDGARSNGGSARLPFLGGTLGRGDLQGEGVAARGVLLQGRSCRAEGALH